MCASFFGTISLSSPTRARPVARTRFSPLAVSGMSVCEVWRPSRDHSVSPWRMTKTRGVGAILLPPFFLNALIWVKGGDQIGGKGELAAGKSLGLEYK